MGTTTDWRGMVLTGGGLCQLLTDNLLRVITILFNFVQYCIVLAKNNVMSVLAPI